MSGRRRVAIVGTGVAGLTCAHLLHRRHDLTLFEAGTHVGGHVITTDVERDGRSYAVDAGFVVYNERNYPLFVRLLDRLDIDTRPTSMSFSVRSERSGLEYCGTSLATLFAQRRNVVRPRFYRLLADIVRFNRAARRLVLNGGRSPSLARFLDDGGYGRAFRDEYLVAMAAAIWSTAPERMLETPARFLFGFLDNHRLLSLAGRPEWRTVRGGSRRYVEALIAPLRDRIRLRTPVARIERRPGGVEVTTAAGGGERFDEVIVAAHSDQALAMLAAPTDAERDVLGAMPYQANEAALHADERLLPRRRRARASWNYHLPAEAVDRVRVTYDMCRLQGLDAEPRFLVSLNQNGRIAPASVVRRFHFAHPLYTEGSVAAQAAWEELSGADRIHYCGAYWGHGFHEDGVRSGVAVAERFGGSLA